MPLSKLNSVDIIDIGTGNIASLCSAFKKINVPYNLCSEVSDFRGGKIILPGVGAFADFMNKLKRKKIDQYIIQKSKEKISILGVCLGFEILFSTSTEHRLTNGLNLLKGDFDIIKSDLLIPHVGWNHCEFNFKRNELFYDIENSSDFYFAHSYILKNYEKKYVTAFTRYGAKFPSAVNKNNIYGVQFHPEKSQSKGLRILKNFYERC